jgi:predicted metalloprotease with PDZ domain
LMWLDADTIIRERTHGKKSLDDYCKVFAGGVSSPRVVTYTRADLEKYLNEVVPYDWHGFFERYVYSISPKPPTDEIARAGYRLVYNSKPNEYIAAEEKTGKFVDSWYDAGVDIRDDGTVGDVRQGSPAWNAGLAPRMKIVSVNMREFTPAVWRNAIAATSSSTVPIGLIVKHGDNYDELTLHYTGGTRIPHLVRIAGATDMLADIVRPHAK